MSSTNDEVFLTPRKICDRYGFSAMTLWRLTNDPSGDFPKPLLIGRRRYYALSELVAWERRRADTSPQRDSREWASVCGRHSASRG